MESFEHVEAVIDHPLYTLVDFPTELLVYIFSFLTSVRDRVKLRYVSRQLRAAVEVPSLWRDFIWPHFDFRERRSIGSAMKSCGRYVIRLAFPDNVVYTSFRHCSNVLRLSLPSVRLGVDHLRIILQSMKKLQYLDILWAVKNDAKLLLLMVGYPVYGRTIKELTIREEVEDSSSQEALVFLLNEWAASMLAPQTINIVSRTCKITNLLDQWWTSFKNSTSQPGNHIGFLNVYSTYGTMAGFVPTCPLARVEISLIPSCSISFVHAENYGLPDSECIWLTEHRASNGNVIYKGELVQKIYSVYGTPKSIKDIAFLTHFSAARYHGLFSEHLETLAVACPNLKELSLIDNVNCLKCLRGLHTIATHCKNLEGLNIVGIPAKELESRIKLWEILVDLELTYLAIEICCLLWFDGDYNNKAIIINLHQKCVKLKALQSQSKCTECKETKEPLLLSSFPSLIHCATCDMENVIIHDKLKYLWYIGHQRCYWEMSSCSLEHVNIFSKSLELPESFMVSLSAHGGLVHVILHVKSVTQTGIEALIGNSPNLITFHVHNAGLCVSTEFNLRLKRRYANRKLFLCGSFRLIKSNRRVISKLFKLYYGCNMNFVSAWTYFA